MPAPGMPHAAVREPVNVGVERTLGVDAHVRNEELIASLQKEERSAPFGTEPSLVGLHEGDDLILGHDELIEVVASGAVDVGELAVLDHLVDFDVDFRRRDPRDIKSPVLEVAIDPPPEYILRLGNRPFAGGSWNG